MGWGFLAPFFLAGAALLIVPWIVHQIRRPKHKPTRFSSLMFVPKVRKEVLKRRKIQHPLLMLLRMVLLALLALAFARPFRQVPANRVAADGRSVRHVILLDTSYSMGTRGANVTWFDEAKKRGLEALDAMGRADRVAVIGLGSGVNILAPLASASDAEAGSIARARSAIKNAELTWQTTSYLPALQAAQELLINHGTGLSRVIQDHGRDARATENSQARMAVHLISDFQHAGMPETAPAWKLSPRIDFEAIEVGSGDAPNFGVTDLALDETRAGQLRIRAKVKNWNAPGDGAIKATLVAGDAMQAGAGAANPAVEDHERAARATSQTVSVKAGNATQVIFNLPWNADAPLAGRLDLDGDALDADNHYYFAWNPHPRHDVLLAADPVTTAAFAGGRWPAVRFVRLTLPDDDKLPWVMRMAEPEILPRLLAEKPPEIAIAVDLGGAREQAALLDFVRRGGAALIFLNGKLDRAAANANLLAGLGLNCAGMRTNAQSEASFACFSWVDLEHRVFLAFHDPRYSDFSALHFFNYQRLTLEQGGAETPRVLARMDNGDAAIVEVRAGKGRAIVWAFGLDLDWTNLPKKGAFVPLLHETLGYLTPADETTIAARVGESLGGTGIAPVIRITGETPVPQIFELPGGETRTISDSQTAPAIVFSKPGILKMKSGGAAAWSRLGAVNVDPREGDPLRVSAAEFKTRLCSPSAARIANPGAAEENENPPVKIEYGREALVLLLVFLLLECLYAATLAKRLDREKVEVER